MDEIATFDCPRGMVPDEKSGRWIEGEAPSTAGRPIDTHETPRAQSPFRLVKSNADDDVCHRSRVPGDDATISPLASRDRSLQPQSNQPQFDRSEGQCPCGSILAVAGSIRSQGVEDNALGVAPAAADLLESSSSSSSPSSSIPESSSSSSSRWFRLADAARVWGVSKPTVRARIADRNWPTRIHSNRLEFSPPAEESAALEAALGVIAPEIKQDNIEYATAPKRSRELALMRQAVVHFVQRQIGAGKTFEKASQAAVIHFATAEVPHLFSTASVRRWLPAYAQHGLNGLVDRKAGNSGRKPAAAELTSEQIIRGQAMGLEYGSIAKAARVLSAAPDLTAGAREYIHGAHAAKSYVTPSIRRALAVAPLTKALVQGPRKARLEGRYTVGDYSDVKAGDVFCSDDMTSNVLCWLEWPNAQGWRIVQAQILPVLDVGSLRWLNVRVIARDGGQYTADDIWGLFGDVFDTFGLPNDGFLLEGGHWQSNKVRGAKTDLADDERIGGLEGLGLKMRRSYDPRSKHIEMMFNHFQTEVDRVTGYAGRDQRKQLPEAVKKQVALCKGGHNHPREFFLHISQYATHCQDVMASMNHERREGQILKGESALEKWANDNPQLRAIPPECRWMYRSDRNIVQVTKNGLRITQGSGAKQLVHYFDAPFLVPRKGTKVVVFWNSGNPDADAIVIDHASGRYLGAAPAVPRLGRFSATPAELEAEAKRKQAAMHYARTEMRSIQPELARRHAPVPYDGAAADLGQKIRAATDRAEAQDRTRKSVKQIITRGDVDFDDLNPRAVEPATGSEPDEDFRDLLPVTDHYHQP